MSCWGRRLESGLAGYRRLRDGMLSPECRLETAHFAFLRKRLDYGEGARNGSGRRGGANGRWALRLFLRPVERAMHSGYYDLYTVRGG